MHHAYRIHRAAILELKLWLVWFQHTFLASPCIADFQVPSAGLTLFPSPRLYEKQDLPDGLVILGDSACALNPVYGQGMTVGILQAKALGPAVSQALRAATSSAAGANVASHRAALSGVSQKQMGQLGEMLRFPWTVATGTDAPFLPDSSSRVQ